MSQAGLQQQTKLIAALLDPALYPHQAKTVRIIETHISWVLLAGRYAYKIKKALDLGFINASTLASRRHYCEEELRLNRRLAPRLYLAVVALSGSHLHPVWGGDTAIEYAVKMRRFASNKTFERLIVRNKLSSAHMDELAAMLAHFHTGLPAAPDNTSLHDAVVQNFSQLADLLPDAADASRLNALRQASEHAYRSGEPLMLQRRTQGYVRECHGDLHLGNIVLSAGHPVPFDGIDFDPALRNIDVMDEIAFLFMDLLYHRRGDLAYRFLNAYLEQTGDYAGVELLDFYCVYRATVRAKVNAIRARQQDLQAMISCRAYLSLAGTFIQPRRARLLITHGLPGSGKSTFSQHALEHLGAIRLRSDVERKRLFGLSALDKSLTQQNIYSTEATQRTYARLLATARGLLNAGHTVIIDAAFLKHDEREMFRKLAMEVSVSFAIASLQADDATLRTRILQRSRDASEADLGVLDKLQAIEEPLTQQEMSYAAAFTDITDLQSVWATLDKLLEKPKQH